MSDELISMKLEMLIIRHTKTSSRQRSSKQCTIFVSFRHTRIPYTDTDTDVCVRLAYVSYVYRCFRLEYKLILILFRALYFPSADIMIII